MNNKFLRYLLSGLLAWYLMGCSDQKTPPIENLRGGNIQVIGHGGSGFLSLFSPFNALPPNSLASLSKALFVDKSDGVEIDVQMSKDSVLILYHDKKLESKTSSQGYVGEKLASEILGLEYLCGFPYDFFQHEQVISLNDLLQVLKNEPNFPFLYLDVKTFSINGELNYSAKRGIFVRALSTVLDQFQIPKERIIIISKDENLLDKIKDEIPRLLVMFDASGFEHGLRISVDHEFHGLVMNKNNISPSQVQKTHHSKIQVVLFGGKSQAGINEAIQKNPDVLQVNNVPLLKELLKNYQ